MKTRHGDVRRISGASMSFLPRTPNTTDHTSTISPLGRPLHGRPAALQLGWLLQNHGEPASIRRTKYLE